MDSEHCAMCDEPIAALVQLQTDRFERTKEKRQSKRQLFEAMAQHDQKHNELLALQKKIIDTREAMMVCDEDIHALKRDMEQLHIKYNEETAQIRTMEDAKLAAKREIEDLGQHLFKEAREMVSAEQQEKVVLQASFDQLQQEHRHSQDQLQHTLAELKLLRDKITSQDDAAASSSVPYPFRHSLSSHSGGSHRSAASSRVNLSSNLSTSTSLTDDDPASTKDGQASHTSSSQDEPTGTSTPPSFDHDALSAAFFARAKLDMALLQQNDPRPDWLDSVQLDTFEDDQMLADFQEFMTMAASTTSSLRRLHALPFMKFCLADDIEPCLRFGPTPKLTNYKKILEAIQIKTCFVEACPPGFVREHATVLRKERIAKRAKPSLWDKFTGSDDVTSSSSTASAQGYIQCATCGRKVQDNEDDASGMETELSHRFRISYFDEWACIDRFCADRLNAVIGFYAFLRQLRLGTFKDRSLMDIYQECSRLRLQMSLSRMGSLRIM
ncbi:hypothetical protein DM01DRAFT_1331372, partial [Hesseltinella vesiculosa]